MKVLVPRRSEPKTLKKKKAITAPIRPSDEGIGFDAQLPKQGRETTQSEHGQTTRQAVDTVDQVHGIHDEQAQEAVTMLPAQKGISHRPNRP